MAPPPQHGHVVCAELRHDQLRAKLAYVLFGAAHQGGTDTLLHHPAPDSDLGGRHERVTTDLGVLGAVNGASQALTLLLDVLTVRTADDHRAENSTPNLARAADHLETAAEQLRRLFAASRDAAALLGERA